MSIVVLENKTLMEQIREEASRRVVLKGDCRGVNAFLERLTEESLIVWLEYFPKICYEVRRVNHEAMKLMQEISNKGKYTDSYGWSDNYEFKHEYEYTPEFYFFMSNYVYSEFFSSDNKKVHRQFMKKIMRGDDAIETLMWAKKIYGSNKQFKRVVCGGVTD